MSKYVYSMRPGVSATAVNNDYYEEETGGGGSTLDSIYPYLLNLRRLVG